MLDTPPGPAYQYASRMLREATRQLDRLHSDLLYERQLARIEARAAVSLPMIASYLEMLTRFSASPSSLHEVSPRFQWRPLNLPTWDPQLKLSTSTITPVPSASLPTFSTTQRVDGHTGLATLRSPLKCPRHQRSPTEPIDPTEYEGSPAVSCPHFFLLTFFMVLNCA